MIGRRGSTAQGLRTLLRALGAKNTAHYNLKIVNNDEREDADPAVVDNDVENTTSDSVENDAENAETESDFAKKSRQELAELDDLDI